MAEKCVVAEKVFLKGAAMGANRFKGEVEFEADGTKYKFRLGTNDLIQLQDDMGMKDDDEKFLARLLNFRGLTTLRQLFRAGLRRNHPELTDENVGDIIDHLGMKAAPIIRESMQWMFPEPQAGGGVGKENGSPSSDSTSPPPEQASDPISPAS